MLEIRLFGAPTIFYESQPLEISRRITRALLYYLAAIGKPVGRAHLATLFWPDLPEKKSLTHLRDQLGKLRKELPDRSILNVTRQSVSLDFERIFVDALKFQELYAQLNPITWTLPPDATIPIGLHRTLVEIANLWATPGFLTGVDIYVSEEYEDWLTVTRQNLESEYLGVIQRLSHHERATGNFQLAIHWLRKALEHNPQSEKINSILITTYLENGRHTEARNQFEYVQKMYAQDGYHQLPDSLEALRNAIFNQEQKSPVQEEHNWPLRPSFTIPYIGQEQIFSRIEAIYKKGGMCILHGESGAGKTRLAQEVYKRIQPRPRLFLTACYAHKTDVPFHPWSELFRKYVTKDEWLKLSSFDASMLSTVIPELASWRQDLQSVPDVITARVRQNLFDSICHLLEMLLKDQPVMLFLDDVHWADESSSELIAYLLNRSLFRQSNHILLMATRVEEENPGLKKALQTLPHRYQEKADLERLTLQQIKEVTHQILEKKPSLNFIERLTKITGGNPYFVLESLQAILDSPVKVSLKKISDLPITDNVHNVIRYRLQNLSPDAYEVIETAAIFGNQFSIALVEKASAYPMDRLIQAMDELRTASLIADVHSDTTLQYAFLHEIIRESLLQDLSPLRAKLLHRNAAQALADAAQEKTEETAAILAQHYEGAEDFSTAFDYWVQWAKHAYHMTSIKESIQAFKHAKHLLDIAEGFEDIQLYKLYTEWSGIAFNVDDPVEIERLNRELLEFGQERKSDLLIGTALDGLSDAYFASNQYKDGLDFALEAAPYLERAGHSYELLQNQLHSGVFNYMLGNLLEARETFYKVLEQMPTNDSPNFVNLNSNLHYQIGILEVLMGYPVKGFEYLDRAIKDRKKRPVVTEIMSINAAMGLAYYLKGDFKAGRAVTAKAIEMGEQVGYWRMLGYAYAYSSLNVHYLGLLDEAWEHATKALHIGETYGHPEISALAYRTMGHIYLRLQDYQSAIEYLQLGIQAVGEHFAALELMTLLGYALAAIGKVEEGIECLTRAYQTSSRLQLGCVSVYAHSMLLIIQGQHMEIDNNTLEEIEWTLVDAKARSLNRTVALLKAPFVRVSRRSEDYIKQVNDLLSDVSTMSDPLFETNVLPVLIEFKKEHGFPWQADAKRLDVALKQLAPHTAGMPFEEAWQKYVYSLQI